MLAIEFRKATALNEPDAIPGLSCRETGRFLCRSFF